jgi:Trypsin
MTRNTFRVLAVAAVVASTLLSALPAGSIVNGQLDGNGHPAVGGLVAELEVEPGVFEKVVICSGSLISATPPVFLTAGHCTAFLRDLGITQVWVSFDSVIDPDTSTLIPGTYVIHPDYRAASIVQADNDISVVLLQSAPSGVTPVDLPGPGLLDSMRAAGTLKNQLFTAVGYGVQASLTGPPTFTFDGARRVALLPFLGLPREWLLLSQAVNATGEGGACSGDSGSPKFIGNSNTIVAVENWGDAPCRATSFSWRLDIPSSQDFLDDFVEVPSS